ncbi:MAG: TIGR03546 family protein [Planctomycetales bacterium]|nr:TIGR03546 family protein [Planctomycetales bacterium]
MIVAWLSKTLRSLRDALEFGDSSRQLALGIALGMVIGLVPKGNLLCVLLCLATLSTRVNLGTTMISAVVFSLLSPLADPLTHRIGLQVLTWEFAKPMFDVLYNLPIAPWTAFNNTVVLGSLLLGLTLLLPTYWIAKVCLEATADAPARVRTRSATVTATASRTYVATTTPLRVDGNQTFHPTIAMAEPADEEQLAKEHAVEEAATSRRIEPAHNAPGPRIPTFTPVDTAHSVSHTTS